MVALTPLLQRQNPSPHEVPRYMTWRNIYAGNYLHVSRDIAITELRSPGGPQDSTAPEGPFFLRPSRLGPPILQISKLRPRRESDLLKGKWLGQSWELSPGFLRPGVCSTPHDDQWLWVTRMAGSYPHPVPETRETMGVRPSGLHL